MNISFTLLHQLPPLAWNVQYLPSDNLARVRHGKLVEVGDDYFVEGVWPGEFAAHDFDRVESFFGSGGRLRGGFLVLVPSSSTTNFCYVGTTLSGVVHASNSLSFLLAALGDELDPHCREYMRRNDSIMAGINDYDPELPTLNGTIRRLAHKNAWIGAGQIRLEDKPLPPSFEAFAQYKNYLVDTYASICANARSASRQNPMRITSTQSKGYDSTAMNAIAAKFGLDAVFSVARGKGRGRFADDVKEQEVDDSGEEIGKSLGFTCRIIERRALESQPEMEHLYYCSVHASGDTNMAGINPYVKAPSLLLTGCLGEITAPWEYYWRYGYQRRRIADFERGDQGGHGLGEVRLSVGFVDVPFFFIGGRSREHILNITAMPEMDDWRMHNQYDRPISRRIAEEAGVPRHSFGQIKSASAMILTPPRLPKGKELRDEYVRYLDATGTAPSWRWRLVPLVHRVNRVLWFVSPGQYPWLYYLKRLISRILRRDFDFPIIWSDLDNAFYCFCVNKRVREYRGWMRAGRGPI